MGSLTLWTCAPVFKYRSSVCSKGTFFLMLCGILTFIPPLLIAYRSNGFWLKTDFFREQPDMHFKHNVIVIVDTSTPQQYIMWSSYSTLNDMVSSKLRIPVITSYEDDVNQDGKKDGLHLHMEFPLHDKEKVHGVKLVLGFDMRLYTMVRLQMDCLAYVAATSTLPSGQFTVIGDLNLHQREPLKHRGHHNLYNQEIIDMESSVPEEYDLVFILERYSERNLTTHLENQYTVWSPNGAAASSFTIQAHLKYPVQTIMYTPGVWQVLKMAWVQYLSILIVFVMAFRRIKEYVFINQLVPTWNVNPAAVDKGL